MTDQLFALTGSPDLNRALDGDEVLLPHLLDGLQVQARPYQARITSKAVRMFAGEYTDPTGERQKSADSIMIESPTGSGKTVMGLTVAREMQRRFGYSVGWIAMRRNLLAQAEAENERWGFGLDLKTISMFDKNPPQVDMIVVDEAQHDAAMSMANLHCTIRPQKVLGLSATPFRTDRIKLCFDRVIKDAGIHQLIQDGYLSRYHHYTIPHYTPAAVARHFADEQSKWGKTLIFFHQLKDCQSCQQLLADRGVHAEVVTASSNREKQLADFASGKTSVLINMAILTEGFDCPSLQTVFCRPSSKPCTIQMAGRAFRKHADLPFKQVVQCKKTKHPIIRTAIADEQYAWTENGWRSLTINAQIDAIAARSRKIIGSIQIELPKLVAAHRRGREHWNRFTDSR